LLEPLEGRQLLTTFTGFAHVRHIMTVAGIYSFQIGGPGLVRTAPAGNGAVDVKVVGTTTASTLTIDQIRPRFHVPNQLLSVRDLTIRSGQIGNIIANPVVLDGTLTPLSASVTTLSFGSLGPSAQIDVSGSVGTMTVGAIDLGPAGHVIIAGDLNGSSSSTSTSTSSTPTPAMSISTLSIDGGRFVIGRDSLAPIAIAGDLRLAHNGLFSIGRDQVGTLSVGGSVILDSGGELIVGRNLKGMTVTGNVLVNPTGSGMVVGGDLTGFTIEGIFRGQGSPSQVDLGVGLNLTDFSVLGGAPGQGGIQSANIKVGKNIIGLNVPHGIFNSWITAGISISGSNVGADGVTAIYNSEIDAGTSITNFTAGGDVVSGFPTGGTTGYPTRIVAGKIRSSSATAGPGGGIYLPNGTVDSFTINGNFVDSVIAASDAPYGGDGSLPPPTPYYGGTPRVVGPPPGDLGFNTYDAPAGVTGNIKNYSIRSPGVPTAVYDTTVDPTIDDTVLDNGTVNVKLTGSVVSTPHDDHFDFAGIFAVNTTGVNGGPLPQNPSP
jgi:hypothetical protein